MKNINVMQLSPKQCLLIPYFMILTMYFIVVAFSEINKIVFVVLASFLSVFPIIFLVWSFPKTISICDARKYCGILGPYNAIIASVFLSLHWGKSLKEILQILSVFILLCIIVICFMEVFYIVRKLKTNSDEDRGKIHNYAVPVISSIGAFGGVIGIYLSRYLRQQNINIVFEIIFILIWLFSLMSYSAFVKNRQSHGCKNEYKDKD